MMMRSRWRARTLLVSRDALPGMQVALSRCIVGRRTLPRLERRSKPEGCGAAVSERGGGGACTS